MLSFVKFFILFSISIKLIETTRRESESVINLSVVACGDRVPETLNLLKSALMFTRSLLHFYIITEADLKEAFINQFQEWPQFIQDKFKFTLIEPKFPAQNALEWRKLFKLCASQRLFLPSLLDSVDSIIYVDTDILFISDINDLWQHFLNFNQTQLAALAPEHEAEFMGWYNRFARHPYYGKLGLNSGVMLMNLTRMRETNFISKMYPIYEKYKMNITWGDQCLLNIYFHLNPDKLYLYGCEWNYRPDHCMYGSNCKTAEPQMGGARVLHGCRRVFHDNDKEPVFKSIYNLFDKYNFNQNDHEEDDLFVNLQNLFNYDSRLTDTYCGKSKDIFLKPIQQCLLKHKQILNEYKNIEL
jgi:UDP-xylose:glucoside alpha-1,3-xylosyltransferase